MATVKLIEYEDASAEVKAVYDDILQTRNTTYINHFWKALANQPENLKRVWEASKQIMAPGHLDAVTKEMIYIAVSIVNSCSYCIHTHSASAIKKGMTPEQYEELIAVITMAQQTNAIATGFQIETDEVYKL